jgi:hypothetical protein
MNSTSIRRITRWRAAGVHLALSGTLAVLALLLLFGVWYPQPYSTAAGADRFIMLLIGIDLVLGPLLTLIVYRQGKKGMWFDLVFIATVQLTALVYGLIMISQSRPVFVVVTEDTTFLTTARGVSQADLDSATSSGFSQRSWTGPVLVAAPTPEAAKDREEVLFLGLGGKDINMQPRYFKKFEDAGPALVAQSRRLAKLREHPGFAAAVDAFVGKHAIPIEHLRYQPLRANDPEKDMTLVFDVRDASVVGVIPIDPWAAAADDEPKP